MILSGRWVVLAVFTLLLGGCAQWPGFLHDEARGRQWVPTKAPDSFHLEGRVSVKSGEEAFSGGLFWQHTQETDTLLLKTPLGQGVAELSSSASGVSLKNAEGRQYFAQDAEMLLQQSIGMKLPVAGLTWWVVGHPRPGAGYEGETDGAGYLSLLQQDGWRIEFFRYAREGAFDVPHKLIARRGEALEIRLVVDAWELP